MDTAHTRCRLPATHPPPPPAAAVRHRRVTHQESMLVRHQRVRPQNTQRRHEASRGAHGHRNAELSKANRRITKRRQGGEQRRQRRDAERSTLPMEIVSAIEKRSTPRSAGLFADTNRATLDACCASGTDRRDGRWKGQERKGTGARRCAPVPFLDARRCASVPFLPF
jgi:hypothetical protein